MVEMKLEVANQCPFCGSVNTVRVTANEFERWQSGEFVQNVFPHLSTTEREYLITGTCEGCWPGEFE